MPKNRGLWHVHDHILYRNRKLHGALDGGAPERRKMTGLECLKEEMAKRGCSKAQIESKTVAIVLDILSNTGTKFTEQFDEDKFLDHKKKSLELKETQLKGREKRIEQRMEEVEERINDVNKSIEETKEYIKSFYESLKQCETPEARDKQKLAQLFVNTVNLESSQNNTAFIEGLARILASNTEAVAIERLKSVKTDLSEYSEHLKKGLGFMVNGRRR